MKSIALGDEGAGNGERDVVEPQKHAIGLGRRELLFGASIVLVAAMSYALVLSSAV